MQSVQCALMRFLPLAAVLNPSTGDQNAGIFTIIIALLVISAIALVVLGVMSKGKKKKRK